MFITFSKCNFVSLRMAEYDNENGNMLQMNGLFSTNNHKLTAYITFKRKITR